MKKIFVLMVCFMAFPAVAGDCGAGYIMVDHAKVDGMTTRECRKLWCRDLETGKSMGAGDKAATGYVATNSPVELCDATGNCIECFGDRKWCSDVPRGVWNPEYGAYTRGGNDSASYTSKLKSGCFTWQLEKPNCDDGQDAILQNGEWVCAVAKTTGNIGRVPAMRRTGATRRIQVK